MKVVLRLLLLFLVTVVLSSLAAAEDVEAYFRKERDRLNSVVKGLDAKNDPAVVDELRRLAGLYEAYGRIPQAIETYERVLSETKKFSLPPNGMEIGDNYYLGLLYQNQGDIKKSEERFEAALAGAQKTYRADDKRTFLIVYNYWVALEVFGKKQKAQELEALAKTMGFSPITPVLPTNNWHK